ncbi:MAG: hypothetical protein IKH49_06675 [Bacteroidales bacterium]|nr:hypothetical protein [Bacteroidales bacterium]
MKRIFLILVFSFSFTTCNTFRVRHTLNDVESYLQARPDSAWAVLDGMDRSTLTTGDLRAHHALLYSLAADKTYRVFTDDSIACVATDYYGTHGSRRHRMLAWYSLGIVQKNASDDQRAILSFAQAKEDAKSLEDHHYLGLIYSNMAELFSRVYDHGRAYQLKEQSIAHHKMTRDSIYVLYGQVELASYLYYLKRYDDAVALLDSLYGETRHIPTLNAWIKLQQARIISVHEPVNPDRARASYNAAILLDAPLSSLDYGNLSFLYALEGEKDSSDYYLEKSRSMIGSETDSMKWVYDRYRQENAFHDYELALSDYRGVMDYQDSLLYILVSQSVLHALHDDQQSRLKAQRLEIKNQRLAILAITVLLCLASAYFRMRVKKKERMLKTAMEQVSEMQDCVDSLKDGRGQLLGILKEQYMDKIRSLKSLSSYYFYWDKKSVEKKKRMGELRTEGEILDKFQEQLTDLRQDSKLMENLEKALNETTGHLMEDIREAYRLYGSRTNQLDDDDYHILVLILAGFGSQQVSLISGVDYDVVRKRKSRYLHKIGSLPSPHASLLAERMKKYL